MTVCLKKLLPKTPNIHRICRVLANPTYARGHEEQEQFLPLSLAITYTSTQGKHTQKYKHTRTPHILEHKNTHTSPPGHTLWAPPPLRLPPPPPPPPPPFCSSPRQHHCALDYAQAWPLLQLPPPASPSLPPPAPPFSQCPFGYGQSRQPELLLLLLHPLQAPPSWQELPSSYV